MCPHGRNSCLSQKAHGYLHPMLWGCVPVVVLHFWSWIPPSYGYLHPTLWGCVPIVIFHSRSTISREPTPYTAGMRPHGRISFLIYCFVNSWARTPILYTDLPSYLALIIKSSPCFIPQGHLHPLISVVSSQHPNPSRNSFLHGTSVCAYQPWPQIPQPPD